MEDYAEDEDAGNQGRVGPHRRHDVVLRFPDFLIPIQLARHGPKDVQPERDHRAAEHDRRDKGSGVRVDVRRVRGLLRCVRARVVPAHPERRGRRRLHDHGERLVPEELVDKDVRRDPEEREERLEEDPRRFAVRADDPGIGTAHDGSEVEPDPVAQVRPPDSRDAQSRPLPTMLMKTSSRVGSDFCSEWTFAPCDVIELRISATGPSSSRMNVRWERFFEMSSLWEKFFTPRRPTKELVSRIVSTSSWNVVSVRIIRFRFAGVSHARMRPLSMIAIRSHIWSASAM